MINSSNPTLIDASLVIGTFVSKKKAFMISSVIILLCMIIIKIIGFQYCCSLNKKDLKKKCKKFFSSKLLYLIIVYLGYYYFIPIIHGIQDKIINRKAYLTLSWFDKYLQKMSKHNLNGLNFNIHAKFL